MGVAAHQLHPSPTQHDTTCILSQNVCTLNSPKHATQAIDALLSLHAAKDDLPKQQGINDLRGMLLAVWCAHMLANNTSGVMRPFQCMLTCIMRVIICVKTVL